MQNIIYVLSMNIMFDLLVRIYDTQKHRLCNVQQVMGNLNFTI